MAYADLTAEQKASVQAITQFARGFACEIAKLGNHGRAIANYYVGNVESILATLGANDLIPNESGLIGAQSLTKSELVNLIGYAITVSETADNSTCSYNTNYHRSLYGKATGPGNLVG